MAIFLPEDPRSKAISQFGQSVGQGIGQGLSGKTLKSMFQDVLDAGGSPLTAMQKIMPFDSDLAEKLGDAESKKVGRQYIRDVIQRELGFNAPEGVDTDTLVGGVNIQLAEQQREAQATQQGIVNAREDRKLEIQETKAMRDLLESLTKGEKPLVKVTPSKTFPSGFAYTNVLDGTEMAEAPKPSSLVTIQEGKPASPGERTDIADARASLGSLRNLQSLFDASFVGPVAGWVGKVRDIFGGNEQAQSEFNAATSAFKNAVIKQITGAQMSEPEAKRIMKQIPDVNDPPSVWRAKARQSILNIEQMERERLRVLRQSGVRVPEDEASDMSDEELERALRGE